MIKPSSEHIEDWLNGTPFGADPFEYVAEQSSAWALEQAALICDAQTKEPECPERAQYCADAIRAAIPTVTEDAKS